MADHSNSTDKWVAPHPTDTHMFDMCGVHLHLDPVGIQLDIINRLLPGFFLRLRPMSEICEELYGRVLKETGTPPTEPMWAYLTQDNRGRMELLFDVRIPMQVLFTQLPAFAVAALRQAFHDQTAPVRCLQECRFEDTQEWEDAFVEKVQAAFLKVFEGKVREYDKDLVLA